MKNYADRMWSGRAREHYASEIGDRVQSVRVSMLSTVWAWLSSDMLTDVGVGVPLPFDPPPSLTLAHSNLG